MYELEIILNDPVQGKIMNMTKTFVKLNFVGDKIAGRENEHAVPIFMI